MPDNDIPYQPWAAAKRIENFQNRATADPLAQCFMPGVPRIMYLDFPFQIFQTPQMIAMTFEWSSVHRQIYTDGSSHVDGIDFWMGDSRGRWEGDTLVVDVANHNDRTWFDMAGNFHSEALKLVERYTLVDADTIQYEVTVEDPKVFTRPWKISMPFHRHKEMDRILEYQCQAEVEEVNGAFPREPATWYPEPGAPPSPIAAGSLTAFNPQQADRPKPTANAAQIRRRPDGKPDLQGAYMSDGGGANYGLEPHAGDRVDSRRPWDHRRPAGRQAAAADLGQGRGREPEAPRARLRRPDRALFCRRRSTFDVRPVAVPHRADRRSRRVPLRADGVADRAHRRPRPSSRTMSASGRAIRSADGTAIRSSSTRAT